MPTLLILNGNRYRFYSSDRGEPPHVHVVNDGKKVKVWLRSLETENNQGYTAVELRRILKVVETHKAEWIGAFNEFFEV
ncbi:MAG: DUF4160 domain-containing protein [Pseudomonadota bacterium]